MSRTTRRTSHAIAAVLMPAALIIALAGCAGGSGDTANANADCTPQDKFTTVTPGTLTVATYDFAPYTIVDGSSLSGIEGDLLNKIAARECLTLTLVAAGGAAASVPAVQSGRADLAAGDWWRTAARAEIVSLGAPILIDQGAIVSTGDFKTVDDLKGHKVGSVAGNLWNDEFAKLLGGDFTVYQDGESAFTDLAAGRIEAIIDNVASTTVRFQTNPIEGATINPLPSDPQIPSSARPGQLNWPTNKDNRKLTDALDAQIAALQEDGTLVEILKKYGLPESVANVGEPYEL